METRDWIGGLALNRRPEEAVCHLVQTRHSTARLSLDPLLDRRPCHGSTLGDSIGARLDGALTSAVRPRRAVSCVAAYVRSLRGLHGQRELSLVALIDRRALLSLIGSLGVRSPV